MEEKSSSKPFGDYSVTDGHAATREVVVSDRFETIEYSTDAYNTRINIPSSSSTRQRQFSEKNESASTDGSKTDLSPTQEMKEEPAWTPSEALNTDTSKRKRGRSYFERPRIHRLIVHLVVCGCAYPWLLLFAFLGRQTTSLTVARAVVGVGTSILGLAFGAFLTRIASRHFEALSWSTMLLYGRRPSEFTNDRESQVAVKFGDLEKCSDDQSKIATALRLSYLRYRLRRGEGRSKDDSRFWYWTALIVIGLTLLRAWLTFGLNRLVLIESNPRDLDSFEEKPILGDLTDEDISRAEDLAANFNPNFKETWPLTSFFALDNAPSFDFLESNAFGAVFFAQTTWNQFDVDTPYGAFDQANAENSAALARGTYPPENSVDVSDTSFDDTEGGKIDILKWGLRMNCVTFSDINDNVVLSTDESETLVFVTSDILQQLSQALNVSLPSLPTLNVSSIAFVDDVPSSDIPEDTVIANVFSEEGRTLDIQTTYLTDGSDGTGWLALDVILVRVNSTFAPNGSFPLLGSPTDDSSLILYDAAVCLGVVEPYVVEHEVSLSGVVANTITDKSDTISDDDKVSFEPDGQEFDRSGDPANVARSLNSADKFTAFNLSYQNSVLNMLQSNGQDSFYIPTPIVVSFTDGSGPEGYTSLQPDFVANVRSRAIATAALPFLVGGKQLVSHLRKTTFVIEVTLVKIGVAIVVAVLAVLGVLSELTVPRLPHGVPRRGFDLYSWVAAINDNTLELTLDGDALSQGELRIEDVEAAMKNRPVSLRRRRS